MTETTVKETDITVESVKDTDLIMISNNQALTSSLTVAEYFGKLHAHVIRNIESAIQSRSKTGSANNEFFQSSYTDKQGKERPMYYLNRKGFMFIVMGFTGDKAAAWKWRFADAFDRMEETLRSQQQEKPMTSLEILQHQVAVMTEHEQRLNKHDSQILQVQADIKALRDAHNGITLRHELKNNDQQKQLDKHESDITDLQKNMYDLLTEKADISQDMDIFINEVVNCYYQGVTNSSERYKTAWLDFYNAIAKEVGKTEGYIQKKVTKQRDSLISQGIAKTTAARQVTNKTVINSNPDLKNAAIAIMRRISADINAHKQEERSL